MGMSITPDDRFTYVGSGGEPQSLSAFVPTPEQRARQVEGMTNLRRAWAAAGGAGVVKADRFPSPVGLPGGASALAPAGEGLSALVCHGSVARAGRPQCLGKQGGNQSPGSRGAIGQRVARNLAVIPVHHAAVSPLHPLEMTAPPPPTRSQFRREIARNLNPCRELSRFVWEMTSDTLDVPHSHLRVYQTRSAAPGGQPPGVFFP